MNFFYITKLATVICLRSTIFYFTYSYIIGSQVWIMACQPNSAATVLDPIKENYDNYLLIDAGSNMVNKKFSKDLESVLQRAKDSGLLHVLYSCKTCYVTLKRYLTKTNLLDEENCFFYSFFFIINQRRRNYIMLVIQISYANFHLNNLWWKKILIVWNTYQPKYLFVFNCY